MEALQGRDPSRDSGETVFTGQIGVPDPHGQGSEAILREYFEIKTELQTFVGHWMDLPPDSLCELGKSPQTGSLGVNAILGLRFYDSQLKSWDPARPGEIKDYERMLPTGNAFPTAQALGAQLLRRTLFLGIATHT